MSLAAKEFYRSALNTIIVDLDADDPEHLARADALETGFRHYSTIEHVDDRLRVTLSPGLAKELPPSGMRKLER